MKKENRAVVYVGRGCPAGQAVTPLINQNGKEITYCWAKPNLHKQPHGFTLIELLVVVLIIGILAAVAVPQYQMAVEKSRAVQGIVFARALHDAQEEYYLENGQYASSLEDLPVSFTCPKDYKCTFTVHLIRLSYKESTWYISYKNNYATDSYPYLNGKLYCWDSVGSAKSVCSKLGTSHATDEHVYLLN